MSTSHVVSASEFFDGRPVAESGWVEVTQPIFLLLIAQTVKFLGQRAQGFRQQAQFNALHGQLVGPRAEQRTHGTDDITDVPALKRGVDVVAYLVACDVKLDTSTHVSDGDK